MPSRFGWVDFAEEDRKRMLDAVQLFREQDTRDELGIGSIRDGFADYFFPGTSTIQTRARYMLFVPWIYLELEQKRVPSSQIARRARQAEINLIHALLKSSDIDGVIGKDAKDKLQRLPSNIYWSGLASWGIRLFRGSQSQYHSYLDEFYLKKKHVLLNDDREPVGDFPTSNWDPGIPEPPDKLLESAELALTKKEALYLQEQILSHHHDSLLSILVTEENSFNTDFIWNHPLVSSLPKPLYEDVMHAQYFSEVIHGAALLYNLLLSRARKSDEWVEIYKSELDKWAKTLYAHWDKLLSWFKNIESFWTSAALQMAIIPYLTKVFVTEWLRIIFDEGDINLISENQAAQILIRDRELKLKRNRARLENPRSLELWSGASGNFQLDFRWRIAKTLLTDITKGLQI